MSNMTNTAQEQCLVPKNHATTTLQFVFLRIPVPESTGTLLLLLLQVNPKAAIDLWSGRRRGTNQKLVVEGRMTVTVVVIGGAAAPRLDAWIRCGAVVVS